MILGMVLGMKPLRSDRAIEGVASSLRSVAGEMKEAGLGSALEEQEGACDISKTEWRNGDG